MKRFVEGEDRRQGVLLPEFLDDYVSEENPVRAIDVFVEALDLGALGFDGVVPEATGRPGYHPGVLLKIYVYGYINQVASSRRLEREAQRNVEMMWLTGRLAPDFKTIADFRKDNGPAIRAACRQFVDLCRRLELFVHVCVGIQHAHQKAIIHRDLKPSNILVTEMDGKPMPKVIDFGVAKALAQKLTAETIFTQVGAIVGTPEYMSPEQALSSGEDIDTRTDVYSLGVVLYELLAGALPIELRKISFEEFLRSLREKEPLKPSDYERDAALAAQALGYLDSSMPYDDWLEIGMALTPLGRDGLNLWDRWSSDSDKYQEGLCDRKWRSFGKSGPFKRAVSPRAATR